MSPPKETIETIIIGGGLSGLTVAHKLRHQNPGHKLLIIEKNDGVGGAIKSHRDQGYLAEIGPHGFLDNCDESKALLKETGLDKECVKAPLSRFVRYVCIGGKLRLIPQSPPKIIKAPLISWPAKFRVLAELWKKPLAGEPTVAQWAEYRFGKSLLPFIDAVFTGTYAGDFNKLVIDGVMPGVRELEKKHGSVIRGLLAKLKESKNKNDKTPKKKGLPAMTSFPQGMARLPEKLSENLQLDIDLFLNCNVTGISRDNEHWSVQCSKGTYRCKNLVLALPVNASLDLLQQFGEEPPVASIPEAGIATVAFGFNNNAKIPPGFGFLTPEQEQRFSLGCLFSSNMFPGRAPENHILFEVLVGGRRHPERLELDDQTLVDNVLEDMRQLLHLPEDPTYIKILRSSGAIPQLEKGYPELLRWRDRLVQHQKNLFICGFGWDGIGLNDMMKHATRVAEALQAGEENTREESEVKKIYF